MKDSTYQEESSAGHIQMAVELGTFQAAKQRQEQALQDGGVRMWHLFVIMEDWGCP